MSLRFADSASRHGVPHDDAVHAILHAVGAEKVSGGENETLMVFVGHPYPQTDRCIEVIAGQRGSDVVVFHARSLTDTFRHLVRER